MVQRQVSGACRCINAVEPVVTAMQIPRFPECYHALVEASLDDTDQSLLQQLQQQPESGRPFVALFCRYSPLVYSLIHHATPSSVQVDYLFAQVWQRIYQDLRHIDLEHFDQSEQAQALQASQGEGNTAPRDVSSPLTLQNWIINAAAGCIRDQQIPEPDQIRYSLTYAPPPLWCYLERSLDQLSPLHRLTMLLHKRFGWSIEEVAAHLRSEGTAADASAVITLLEESYGQIDESLPQDIRDIYLSALDPKQS
ncbi:MAG: sigma-70 family RNA polymerase sigma factor [Elainellaceae cyanobacterium]